MPMTIDDLKTALEGLPTDRVQRLVDRLEQDPGVEVTVGAWRPQCPMVLAGFEPLIAAPNAPEQRFAAVWDRFATRERHRLWFLPLSLATRRVASREDVKRLLRAANEVLAARQQRPVATLRARGPAPAHV
jgi:hypothetical protein